MRDRAMSAAVFVPLLLLALAAGRPGILLVVVLAVLGGSIEVYRLLRAAGYTPLPELGLLVALAAVVDVLLPSGLALQGSVLVSVAMVVVAVAAFSRHEPHDGIATWVSTVFGALYLGQFAFVLALTEGGAPIPSSAPFAALGGERAWVLLLVFGVWAYDTGAFLVGSRLGGAKFLTHISPSKTYSGLVGGLLSCTAVVAAMLWGLGQPAVLGLALGPLLGLAAQAGDLAESLLKRAAGVKDSGSLIPGHGGVLDRIDSFLFAAPVVALFLGVALG